MGKHSDLPDFDTLLALWEDDPQAFEDIRDKLTRELLAQSPTANRRRLEGLQFRINMELQRARTPEARCRKISAMMHASFAELNSCLNHPDGCVREHRRTADILPLKRNPPVH